MKTLIACLTSEAHAADVLGPAMALAERHSSHLIGLHAMQTLNIYPSVMAHVPEDVIVSFSVARREAADAIGAIFKDKTANASFPTEWLAVDTGAASAASRMVELARTADLVVMPQGRDNDEQEGWLREEMIRHSGRPVLHVPDGGHSGAVGRSVIIGWSPTREAARAVHDALPLLEPGAQIAIVTVGEEDTRAASGVTELARALSRHRHEVEVVPRMLGGASIAKVLTREAHERGADMIVTGAFGHSRLYDFVIGAVSRELMESCDLPVLFSR